MIVLTCQLGEWSMALIYVASRHDIVYWSTVSDLRTNCIAMWIFSTNSHYMRSIVLNGDRAQGMTRSSDFSWHNRVIWTTSHGIILPSSNKSRQFHWLRLCTSQRRFVFHFSVHRLSNELSPSLKQKWIDSCSRKVVHALFCSADYHPREKWRCQTSV